MPVFAKILLLCLALIVFLTCPVQADCVISDLDGDCRVDFADLAVLSLQWLDLVEAFDESGGLVVIESEHYFSKSNGSGLFEGCAWWNHRKGFGAVDGGYIVVLPDSGLEIDTDIEEYSAHLSYLIDFNTPGTYYLWLKGMAEDGNSNSLHFGLDGQAVSSNETNSLSLTEGSVFATM